MMGRHGALVKRRVVDAHSASPYNGAIQVVAPKWRNRQTRRSQKPVPARECGFDSHLRHLLTIRSLVSVRSPRDAAPSAFPRVARGGRSIRRVPSTGRRLARYRALPPSRARCPALRAGCEFLPESQHRRREVRPLGRQAGFRSFCVDPRHRGHARGFGEKSIPPAWGIPLRAPAVGRCPMLREISEE